MKLINLTRRKAFAEVLDDENVFVRQLNAFLSDSERLVRFRCLGNC